MRTKSPLDVFWFQTTGKRRRGYPSETRVKRGDRSVGTGKNFAKNWGARILPMRVRPPVSGPAACSQASSTVVTAITSFRP